MYFVFLLVCFAIVISAIVPPLMSPDEADHIKRAYFLTKGEIVLDSISGGDSGGMLDSGMYDYINSYYSVFMKDRQHKLSLDEISYASSIPWSNEEKFSAAPGTNYYFPAIYTPQAIGLFAGKQLNLSVDGSYRLARLLATLVSGLILLLAFRIYSPPPIVLFLLAIPMSMHQLLSASIDGMTTAIAILAISIFIKICEEQRKQEWSYLIYLSLCMTILITSRIHMLPMVGLIFVTMYYTRSFKSLACGALSLLLIFGWLFIALKTTVDSRVAVGAKTSDVILFYFKDPLAFYSVLIKTITAEPTRNFYFESFIGILGWLDAPFSKAQYSYYYLSAIIPLTLTIRLIPLNNLIMARIALMSFALTSLLFIFFALLVTFNTHPATLIGGVQGRYFTIPIILIAYALGFGNNNAPWFRKILPTYMIAFITISSYTTLSMLSIKYYVNDYSVKLPTIINTEPSPSLGVDSPITISLGEHNSSPIALKRLGVMFATWARENHGTAEIVFVNGQDRFYSPAFELSEIEDNKYTYFNVGGTPVTSAEIKSIDGSGVSIWQAKYDTGYISSCVIFEFMNGAKKYTPGCPKP